MAEQRQQVRVLITRPAEDAERLAEPLRRWGVAVLSEPLLTIAPLPLSAAVPETAWQAVVLTSANGARTLAAALKGETLAPRTFCVGDQTAQVAQSLGFPEVVSAGGDVESLAALIRSVASPTAGPILHAAGSAVAGDLVAALTKDGFDLRREVLYQTVPREDLSAEALAALATGELAAVFLYSPRTARTFVRLLRRAFSASWPASWPLAGRRLVPLCLSPAVAVALGDDWAGSPPLVAEQPTQAAVLDCFARHFLPSSVLPEAFFSGSGSGGAENPLE